MLEVFAAVGFAPPSKVTQRKVSLLHCATCSTPLIGVGMVERRGGAKRKLIEGPWPGNGATPSMTSPAGRARGGRGI
jgi:hypothetical protein